MLTVQDVAFICRGCTDVVGLNFVWCEDLLRSMQRELCASCKRRNAILSVLVRSVAQSYRCVGVSGFVGDHALYALLMSVW